MPLCKSLLFQGALSRPTRGGSALCRIPRVQAMTKKWTDAALEVAQEAGLAGVDSADHITVRFRQATRGGVGCLVECAVAVSASSGARRSPDYLLHVLHPVNVLAVDPDGEAVAQVLRDSLSNHDLSVWVRGSAAGTLVEKGLDSSNAFFYVRLEVNAEGTAHVSYGLGVTSYTDLARSNRRTALATIFGHRSHVTAKDTRLVLADVGDARERYKRHVVTEASAIAAFHASRDARNNGNRARRKRARELAGDDDGAPVRRKRGPPREVQFADAESVQEVVLGPASVEVSSAARRSAGIGGLDATAALVAAKTKSPVVLRNLRIVMAMREKLGAAMTLELLLWAAVGDGKQALGALPQALRLGMGKRVSPGDDLDRDLNDAVQNLEDAHVKEFAAFRDHEAYKPLFRDAPDEMPQAWTARVPQQRAAASAPVERLPGQRRERRSGEVSQSERVRRRKQLDLECRRRFGMSREEMERQHRVYRESQ